MAPHANTPFTNLLPNSTGSFLKTPADPHARLAVLASHIAPRPVLKSARKWRCVRCSRRDGCFRDDVKLARTVELRVAADVSVRAWLDGIVWLRVALDAAESGGLPSGPSGGAAVN